MEHRSTGASTDELSDTNEKPMVSVANEAKKQEPGGIFKCALCSLEEHYDYKGAKPPFARLIAFHEDCYIMKDPMSLPKSGEVLVLGADCNVCEKSVCIGCSIFYSKRYCSRCAKESINNLPKELHAKIKNLGINE